MYNKVSLIGHLGSDPEIRRLEGGDAVARFSVAIDRNRKRADNAVNQTDFIRVVAWNRLAEICHQYLKKGKLVSIVGRLQIDSYEKDGDTRVSAEVVADDMQMLDRMSDVQSQPVMNA